MSGIVVIGIFVVAIINLLFVKIRRLYDFNLSGWWVIATFIPIVGVLWGIVIFCYPGTKQNNSFGEPEKRSKLSKFLLLITLPCMCVLLHSFGYINVLQFF